MPLPSPGGPSGREGCRRQVDGDGDGEDVVVVMGKRWKRRRAVAIMAEVTVNREDEAMVGGQSWRIMVAASRKDGQRRKN